MITLVTITTIMFALAGFAKIAGLEASQAQREDLNVPEGMWRVIGALELLGAAGVGGTLLGLVPHGLGVLAALGFVVLMLGAIVTRLKARSNLGLIIFDVAALGIAVATVWTLKTMA